MSKYQILSTDYCLLNYNSFFFIYTYRDMGNTIDQLFLYIRFMYILVSAYQIRNGYLYRHASSFLWSRYTLFNLMAYKL